MQSRLNRVLSESCDSGCGGWAEVRVGETSDANEAQDRRLRERPRS